MPIKISNDLPAAEILYNENIFVMSEERADIQDIRPLKIAVLNLMPTKIETETQLIRLLGNTPLQVDITLLHPETHVAKNTSQEHLTKFYQTFSDVKSQKFDGLVITGAPVENMEFQDVNYWDELVEIMEWSKKNVFSTFHICWGAQAGLFHHYGIKKYPLEKKMFGIFEHTVNYKNAILLRGYDDVFMAPHSRHTEVLAEDINAHEDLEILAESKEAGVYIVRAKKARQIFVMGHSEYDPYTLAKEYERDVERGMDIQVPKNYYRDNNPSNEPIVSWRGHANLLFINWLNYYVYQETPFNLDTLE